MRIQPARGGHHEVRGYRARVPRVRRAKRRNPATHGLFERRVRGPLVRAAGNGSVIRLRTGCRGAAPEVARTGERLAEQARSDGVAVAFQNASRGLVRKEDTPGNGDYTGIDHAGDHSESHEGDQGGT